MLKAGVSCSLWRKRTWSELSARTGLGGDNLQAMHEGGSVFFSIVPLEILISNSEKYNPCLVGVFFQEYIQQNNSITETWKCRVGQCFPVQ